MHYTRGCWEVGWQSVSFCARIEATRKRSSAQEFGTAMHYTRGCWEVGWQSISFSACIEATRKRSCAQECGDECGGEVGCGPLPSTAPCPQQPLALNYSFPEAAPCPLRPLAMSGPLRPLLSCAAHCAQRPLALGGSTQQRKTQPHRSHWPKSPSKSKHT